jgi:hypothetical protein
VTAFGTREGSSAVKSSKLSERELAALPAASEPGVPPVPDKTIFGKVGVVLPHGSPGEPDSLYARAPFVLRDDDGSYKMWYSGFDGYRNRMLYATSLDGIHWTKHGIVMDVGAAPYYWDSVASQSVLKIQSIYHMWFSAGFWSGGTYGFWAQIYHATSTDGVGWTVTGIALPPNQTWDRGMTNSPWVARDNSGLFWLYFSGWDGSNTRLGVATSTNGTAFTPFAGNPILDLGPAGTWDSSDVNTPSVIPGQTWLLYYAGTDRRVASLGTASSSDGLHWTKSPGNPVFRSDPSPAFDSGALLYPDQIADPSGPRMYYAGGDGSRMQVGLIATIAVMDDAPLPAHRVGDKVGFGATFDLGTLAAPYLAQLQQLAARDPTVKINQLELNGTADLWTTTEVTAKTEGRYAILTNSAQGLQLRYRTDITSTRAPAAGTYAGTVRNGTCLPPSLPLTTARMSVDLQAAYLEVSSDLSARTIANFSLVSQRTNTSLQLRVTEIGTNVPRTDYNVSACTVTVAYQSLNLRLTAVVAADLRSVYLPPFDVFRFPISDRRIWSAYSNATVGGHIGGTIDLKGLDPKDEAAFFKQLNQSLSQRGLSVSGLAGFPIVLEGVTLLVGATPYLKSGDVHDFPLPVTASLHASGRMMTLADGHFHPVYLLSQAAAGPSSITCGSIYSIDDGFIVGYVCETAPGVSVFELKNVPPATAEQKIRETKDRYVVFSTSTDVANFFLKPLFLGLLILAAIAVVGVALVRRFRRRPPGTPSVLPSPDIPEGPPPRLP